MVRKRWILYCETAAYQGQMKALIIEDEQPAIQKLERFLTTMNRNIEIVARLSSVEDSTNWLIEHPAPDLIFMDVRLEDGICFELFEKVNIVTPVVFITAYNEYAIKAFKVNSVDYLLKPLDFDELKKALDKFEIVHQQESYASKIEHLMASMKSTPKERFLIKMGEHYRSIQVDDICHFFIEERNNFIAMNSAKIYPVDYSLDQIEQMVDPKRFFRVNRSCIVNIRSISDILEYSTSRLKLKMECHLSNDDILVSRERVRDFKKWMDR